jgi:choline dehydrogenase-like flavoprotein
MSPVRRLAFVERCFIRDVAERRLPGFLRRPIQSMFVAVQQLTFIGYYGDPGVGAECGYVPFSARSSYGKLMKRVKRDRPRLTVRTPRDIDSDSVEADVAIVGSGAAASIIARGVLGAGRRVLMLERGLHVDPSQFVEDERRMFATLYSDGAFQLSKDARFQVLQGRCVGGTTVVNNAVCFDLPAHVLERWNDSDGLNAGLDRTRLMHSFERLHGQLPVNDQSKNKRLNPGATKFVEGVRELGLDRPPGRLSVVAANIDDCLGCGYCNYGCPYGKKLSMLDTVLPELEAEFGTEALRIFSECRVDHVERANGRGRELVCELPGKRSLRVRAGTVVLSAGAIASSLILARSGLGGPLVGRGLGFNLGAPVHAEFDEKLDSYAGLQISHTLQPAAEDSLILETWFNPVGAESLFMPGWFGDHFRNMRRYDHMACIGAVVGTQRNATVRPARFGRGMNLDYAPAGEDLGLLVRGIQMAGRAFLAAGARRVMPSTFRYLPCESESDLAGIGGAVRDNTDIALHSSHPQGGNPVSKDRSRGVVDPTFRVHDADDLFVCDASVFPSPITVNPQLTVMALADYAAPGIAAAARA